MKKELLKDLTEEQIKKLRECKSPQEILDLAKKEGIELTDEQLEAVSGGVCVQAPVCPMCGSDRVHVIEESAYDLCDCLNCGHSWKS